MNEIEKAAKVLARAGCVGDDMWHREQVKKQFHCTASEASRILSEALSNRHVREQIERLIITEAGRLGLKEKTQE